jgi:hypothetical protein
MIGCLANCGRVATCRGPCAACHARMRQRVRAGETTEAAEVAAGRLRERRQQGHPWYWTRPAEQEGPERG